MLIKFEILKKNLKELFTILLSLIVLIPSVVSYFSLQGCVVRQAPRARDLSQLEAGPGPGLDAGDVSFLYPPSTGYWFGPAQLFEKSGDDLRSRLRELDDVGYWPSLTSEQIIQPGQIAHRSSSFIDDNVFDAVIELAIGNSQKKISGTGVNFKLQHKMNSRVVDMAEKVRWKVTAFRFSPCAIRNYHGQLWSQAGLSTKPCQAEVRIVAQPAIGFDDFEARMGETFPFQNNLPPIPNPRGASSTFGKNGVLGRRFADYAMHLFYQLSEEQALSIAQALQQLKRDFDPKCSTTGKGLGVHPCFYFDTALLEPQVSFEFSRRVREIASKYALPEQLRTLAFMGSNSNQGNWVMFDVNVRPRKEDKEPISGQHETASEGTKALMKVETHRNVTLNSGSLIQEGQPSLFKQGSGVLFTRSGAVNVTPKEEDRSNGMPWQMSQSGRESQTFAIGNRMTIVPSPRDGQDNLSIFLLNQLRFKATGKVKGDPEKNQFRTPAEARGRYLEVLDEGKFPKPGSFQLARFLEKDLLRTAARIDNPRMNDQFTVDCVSCHMVRSEGRWVHDTERQSKLPAPGAPFKDLVFAFGENLLDAMQDSYFVPRGISVFPAAWGQGSIEQSSFQRRGGETYMMNQFSIYNHHPMVSTRVANESAEAADFTNRELLRVGNPVSERCNQQLLKLCILTSKETELDQRLLSELGASLRQGDGQEYAVKLTALGWPRVWIPERELADLMRCKQKEQLCGPQALEFEETEAGFKTYLEMLR